MKISICIVSFKVKDIVINCIESILSHLSNYKFEIILVDNYSCDGTPESVEKLFPQVSVLAQDTNLGFSKGLNIALKEVTGSHILVLNPDTVILPNTIEPLIDFIENHQECGIIGPQLLNEDLSIQNGLRKFPSFSNAFMTYTLLKKTNFAKKIQNKYRMRNADLNKTFEVDQVSGAAMFFKKELLEIIGFFDERFFIYFEEVDFCKRVIQKKYKVFYHPKAQLIHLGGKSSEKVNTLIMAVRLESFLKYLKKYTHSSKYYVLILIFKVSFVISLLFECIADLLLRVLQIPICPLKPKYCKSNKYKIRQEKSKFRMFFFKKRLIPFLLKL